MAFRPIRYRDFWDVPRLFAVEHRGSLYIFDCPFDEKLDEYRESYTIYRVLGATFAGTRSMAWAQLISSGQQVGKCAVSDVRFDPTRRKSIDDSVVPAA